MDASTVVSQVLSDAAYAVLLAVVTVGLPKLAGPAIAYLRLHFTAKQLAVSLNIAGYIANAVEQFAPGLKLKGQAKMDFAIREAKMLAAAQGITLSGEQWQSLLEHWVYLLNHETAALTALTPAVVTLPDPTPAVPTPILITPLSTPPAMSSPPQS